MSGRRAKGKGDQCVFPFHKFVRASMTGGAFQILVSPNNVLTPRGLAEADAWADFRVRQLMFRLHPAASVTDDTAVGYIGQVPDTVPATVDQIGELLASTILGGDTTQPTEWVRPSKSELAGCFPWYKTIPGAADPTEEQPGVICLAGNTTTLFILEVRGAFEFKGAVATANTPAMVNARARIHQERVISALRKERDVLLKVLGNPIPVISDGNTKGTLFPAATGSLP